MGAVLCRAARPAVTSPSATPPPAPGCRSTLMAGTCSQGLGPRPKSARSRPPRLPADRQRNGGAEDVAGIVVPLGGHEPLVIGTIAVRHTLRIVRDEKVRIPTGKRLVSESLARRAGPLAMPFFRGLARRIGERRENFDQYVLAAQAEGRG